jgi:Cu-Zn family superoxide dismutase
MNRRLVSFAAVAVIGIGVATTALAASTAGAGAKRGIATLRTAASIKIGTVEFKTERRHTEVRVRLTSTPGVDAFHGFHIHANDVAENGEGCIADANASATTWFVSADGHYNPTGLTHSQHTGDMPSVYVNADGSVETRFRIDRIDPGVLAGLVVILHSGADNFGNVPVGMEPAQYTPNLPDPVTGVSAATTTTARTGNSGDRIACGLIRSR